MQARRAGAVVLAWVLRLAIFGLVIALALPFAVGALLCGAEVATVLVGLSLAALGGAVLASHATRPRSLSLAVALHGLKRAAISARGLASHLARQRAP
jgi:hypothetical protein